MVTAVTFLAVTTLEEVAHLRLVNTVRDTEIGLSMSKHAVFCVLAFALQEGLAELCLLKIWCTFQLFGRVRIFAGVGEALASFEEGTHLCLRQLLDHGIFLVLGLA